MFSQGVYRNIVDGSVRGPSWMRYRHLLFHLVASDLRARYRRSYLGMAWALIWPIAFSTIIASVAIYIFNQPLSDYVLYVITGFTIWDVIAGCITAGTASIQQGEGYLRQTRLPYLLFPIRTTTFLSVNAIFSSIAAAGLLLVLQPDKVSWTWLLWPFVLALAWAFALPLCLLSAIANMKFRDYQHAIGLVVFLLWYLSPNIVAREVYENQPLKQFTDLNPFASLLDLFRFVTMQSPFGTWHDLVLVLGYMAVLWTLALLWLKAEGRRLIYYM